MELTLDLANLCVHGQHRSSHVSIFHIEDAPLLDIVQPSEELAESSGHDMLERLLLAIHVFVERVERHQRRALLACRPCQ